MTKARVASSDPIEYHDVMLELGKARAALLLLIATTGGYLQIPKVNMSAAAENAARDWIKVIAEDALEDALDDAERAFRKSITPEEAQRQVVGGPQGGA